jgi:AAA+ superfamily predicted ATPase
LQRIFGWAESSRALNCRWNRRLTRSPSSNAIIFFDEADALFGKRSEVKDAHDRYANIEVAYLLQKTEEYEGFVILATNLILNIDDAFKRRMNYTVEFPFPDEHHRELLCRGMFPLRPRSAMTWTLRSSPGIHVVGRQHQKRRASGGVSCGCRG